MPVEMRRPPPPAPRSYIEFLDSMRAFVESKGVSWEILLDPSGFPQAGQDWDLRRLTGGHAASAARTNGFAIDEPIREAAIAAGRDSAEMPSGSVLSADVQEFIKAIVAYRCSVKLVEKSTRHYARIYRKFFSVTTKAPWDLRTEDFDRFLALSHSNAAVPVAVVNLANIISENMLSLHCPVEPEFDRESTVRLQFALGGRKDEEKLPESDALFELARIVFQEQAKSHQDLIRFAALRVLILTGLRLNEVLMLPLGCLRWERHVDVVTGKPAGEVGGVSRSLRLRYFAEKHIDGGPDILVEAFQWIPERFQRHVADAIKVAVRATASLRRVLAMQHKAPEKHQSSDLRHFKTNEGVVLTTADLLFLVPYRSSDLPRPLPLDVPVAVTALSSMYQFLAEAEPKSTVFTRYSKADGASKMALRPHSLRHLMNTELFRLEVPDTAITHQFGRKTVAQSYVYDQRTLAERLRFVQLPETSAGSIRPGSTQELVAKMVVGGAAAMSHIGQSFKNIQAEHGDEVAFRYLAANSDGFHVTPYGFCTNSFSVNPCSRHLKCFDNCSHYVASGTIEHKVSLKELRSQLVTMRRVASANGPKTLGRKNQIAHADRLIAGISKALEAQPGALAFPQGTDHSAPARDLFR